ncbi:MAG: hypothetical protein KJ041_10985, partial [Gammaproteobacteria bacterium]|nr:hypothetical protein [Gammaproteobacteria bacterium]
VDGELRFTQPATLPERVTALVLDPATEALVVGATADDISTHGLPLDRFDLALVAEGAGLSGAAGSLLKDCCGVVRQDLAVDGLSARAWPDIQAVLERRAARGTA